MGRVRKYKKVKAMDPFAKGGGGGRMGMGRKGGSDLDRNLPPDVKNHQAQKQSVRTIKQRSSTSYCRVCRDGVVAWSNYILRF